MKVIQSVELYFNEGSSDKVYNVSLEEVGLDKYVVNFAYGRRGAGLNRGSKTLKPVPYDKAVAVYTKLVESKTGKGYRVIGGDLQSIPTQEEVKDTGVRPQLLNDIEEEDVEEYLNNPNWCAQEKYDGRRRLLLRDMDEFTGANRKGQSVAISEDTVKDLVKFKSKNFVLDGEDLGDKVILFDLISVGDLSYVERYNELQKVFPKTCKTLVVAPTAWTATEKRELYKQLKEKNAEGIVFKNIKAPKTDGRPNSGGNQLKFKFYATASCVVDKVNQTKRSVSLLVFQGNTPVEVGNVTVYPNQTVPKKGSIVEVKYLYYFPGGSLFQPVLLGERDDLHPSDCTLQKLKVKQGETVNSNEV